MLKMLKDLEDVESEMDDDQDDFSVDEEGNIAEPVVSEKVDKEIFQKY